MVIAPWPLPLPVVLNGQPATVFVLDGRVTSALAFDIRDGLIVGIRAVNNPDKLERLNAQVLGAPTSRDALKG